MLIPYKKLLALLFISIAFGAQAQEESGRPACLEVEVNGQRIPSQACLQERLTPPPERPRPGGREYGSMPMPDAPHRLGLPTPATLGNRMGDQLGRSAFPQRPSVAPATPSPR